jgi:hypothetical protein
MLTDRVRNLGVCRDMKAQGWDSKTKETKCRNDGRQFAMTKLQRSQNVPLAHGRLSPRYDREVQNRYALFSDDGAGSDTLPDIRQYHVTLTITGSRKQGEDYQVGAEVAEYQNSKRPTSLGTRAPRSMKDGQYFFVKGLPKTLRVDKSGDGCGTYTFTYADPKTDGHRVHRFRSDDKTLMDGKTTFTKDKGNMMGHYCYPEAIEGEDENGDPEVQGTKLHCSFPGW